MILGDMNLKRILFSVEGPWIFNLYFTGCGGSRGHGYADAALVYARCEGASARLSLQLNVGCHEESNRGWNLILSITSK